MFIKISWIKGLYEIFKSDLESSKEMLQRYRKTF